MPGDLPSRVDCDGRIRARAVDEHEIASHRRRTRRATGAGPAGTIAPVVAQVGIPYLDAGPGKRCAALLQEEGAADISGHIVFATGQRRHRTERAGHGAAGIDDQKGVVGLRHKARQMHHTGHCRCIDRQVAADVDGVETRIHAARVATDLEFGDAAGVEEKVAGHRQQPRGRASLERAFVGQQFAGAAQVDGADAANGAAGVVGE